jgi:hypothetical protein
MTIAFKGIDHLHKRWSSLTDLMAYLQNNTTEKVVYFDGMKLVTEKGEYGLADGQLSFVPTYSNDSTV